MKYLKINFYLIILFFSLSLNAQRWSMLDDGMNNVVRDLYVDTVDNLLYIGGIFSIAGADTVNGIAVWDGLQFYALGTGMDNCESFGCANPAKGFIRYQNEIYSGVRMRYLNGIEPNGIARWDGNSWNLVGDGLHFFDGYYGTVSDFIIWQEDLYTVGSFNLAGQDTAHSVARWDGEQWHSVNFPKDNPNSISHLLEDVFVFNNELYVAGNFKLDDGNGWYIFDIMKHNGTEWTTVANGSFGGAWGAINKMIAYQGELYIGGPIATGDGNAGNGILKLQGNEWVDVGGSFGHPYNQIFDMVVYNDKLYVFGGSFNVITGDEVDFIAIWDGEHWSGTGSTFDNRITTAAIYNDSLIIGGGFDFIDGIDYGSIAQWKCTNNTDSCTALISPIRELPSLDHTLIIYPNPGIYSVSISIEDWNSDEGLLRIFNIFGKTVFMDENFTGNAEIDIHTFPPGVYWVKLSDNSGRYQATRPFLIQQ